MVGDPVCDAALRKTAVDCFFSHARDSRLRPAAVQVGRPIADLLSDNGGYSNCMGYEAIVDLPVLTWNCQAGSLRNCEQNEMGSKPWRHVVEADYKRIPQDFAEKVSQEWLRGKINQKELGLLLGLACSKPA